MLFITHSQGGTCTQYNGWFHYTVSVMLVNEPVEWELVDPTYNSYSPA